MQIEEVFFLFNFRRGAQLAPDFERSYHEPAVFRVMYSSGLNHRPFLNDPHARQSERFLRTVASGSARNFADSVTDRGPRPQILTAIP